MTAYILNYHNCGADTIYSCTPSYPLDNIYSFILISFLKILFFLTILNSLKVLTCFSDYILTVHLSFFFLSSFKSVHHNHH